MRTSLLNRVAVRRMMLATAKRNRHHEFTRVSKETIDKLEDVLKRAIVNHVATSPSKGKTL